MLGLEKDSVKLAPHDERWHQLFDEEKARIENAVGKHILAVEHLGSTSVCGISAKPILNIGAAIENFSDGERLVAPLENLGYIFRGENGIAGRHYFVKGDAAPHTSSAYRRSQKRFMEKSSAFPRLSARESG